MYHVTRLFLIGVCICGMSCAGDGPASPPPIVTPVGVATVSVSPSSFSLAVGESQKASAVVKDAAGNELTNRTVSWSASNPALISVAGDGTVTGVATGSTTLTATSEGVTGSAAVLVIARPLVVSLDYSRDLGINSTPRTISVTVTAADTATRSVTVNGVDTRAPTIPFTFVWGDGSISTGFFPQNHIYPSTTQNYLVRVVAHYSATESDSADAVVRYRPLAYTPTAFLAAATVTIPQTMPALTSRQPGYGFSSSLEPVPASLLSTTSRSVLEYVLSQAATVELGILENDVEKVNGEWRQVVVLDPFAGGAYSIWYASPIAFASGPGFFTGAIGYSSLFHEMGHNLSLNAPAAFRFGGRIDGNANAIFSESVAQMFQHAVAFEMVNNAARYGLSPELASDIASSAHSSAQIIQSLYQAYLTQGKPFTTWNDPATGVDETLGSFMAVAHEFMIHAEQAKSYIGPLTRVMKLLRTFNPSLASQYAPQDNSSAANTFRATLMVAALSYGFQQDLRAEFRALTFPIDDSIYASLVGSVP